jgi:hypothetical protein
MLLCAIWNAVGWPQWRPVLLLTMHPVNRALIWRANRVRCVWHLSWRPSWGPPHLHVANWLPRVEPTERLRRVLLCLCGAPMFSASRLSVCIRFWTGAHLGSAADADHSRVASSMAAQIVRPHALGSRPATSRPGFPEASLLLRVHPCLGIPFSALRVEQPFPMDRYLACCHVAWCSVPVSL